LIAQLHNPTSFHLQQDFTGLDTETALLLVKGKIPASALGQEIWPPSANALYLLNYHM
jgi:hypothetical protein